MERWDIYDANKNKTGRTMAKNDRNMEEGDFHLTVLGIIERSDRTFLITKRAMDKSWAPGAWEVPGGGVQAGESSHDAVVREIFEETGIDVTGARGRCLFSYRRVNPTEKDNYFVDVYRFRIDVSDDDVKLLDTETIDFRFADADEIGRIAGEEQFLHYESIKRAFEGDENIIIRGGRIINPSNGTDARGDLWISDGRIVQPGSFDTGDADRIIDATGYMVMPGFIDLHCHLRDPGQTHKETIETGCAAAAKGGFTTLFAMPNTNPVADNGEAISYTADKAAKASRVRVYQTGAVTKNQEGRELADHESMRNAGMITMSEDGKSLMDSGLMRKALRYCAENDILMCSHCEDINLVEGGVMNQDENAKRLSLKGISNSVEDIITWRDILLARETGARLHLCHVSTEDAVGFICVGKAKGVRLTAEVTPHHFSLCSDDIPGDDPNYKMNPPLRSKKDKEAVIMGLRNGIIDVIATDHAPHTKEEKSGSFNDAPFGITGFETAAALTWTNLVEPGIISALDMARLMSFNPAHIAGITGGTLDVGESADVVIMNITDTYEIDPDKFLSKGKNTPFAGTKVRGRVVSTIIGGEVVYDEYED